MEVVPSSLRPIYWHLEFLKVLDGSDFVVHTVQSSL